MCRPPSRRTAAEFAQDSFEFTPGCERSEACVRELAKGIASAGRSRTCLVFAVRIDTRCHFASFGDSSIFRASEPEPISVRNDFILGPDLKVRVLPPPLWAGHLECQLGERVALVTDGVTNFLKEPGAVSERLRSADDDAGAARSIARGAMEAGAGDNIAVATLR